MAGGSGGSSGVSLMWLEGDRDRRELCGVCVRGEISSQLLEKHFRHLLLHDKGKARKDLG